MLPATPLSIAVRSYGPDCSAHAHDFAQLVLPLGGAIEIDVQGHGARLDRTRAAYVSEAARHGQAGIRPNRVLVVDLDPQHLDGRLAEHLASRRFLPVSPAAAHLVDYMAASLEQERAAARAALWTPLLLDALDESQPRPLSRLAGLLATLDANPGYGWTAADMAARTGLSVSRLHAVFREELDTTPRAWLADRRLARARQWLAGTDLPIAEVAYRAGYADQSALTRAFGKASGSTPAAYRRQARETRPKKQEP